MTLFQAHQRMVSGHNNLCKLAERVKFGIYRTGGTPVEFGIIVCYNGISDNHYGAHYVLPSRENIADAAEIQARAHKLDALVLLASCDKIVPGTLMATARPDIPAVYLERNRSAFRSGEKTAEMARSGLTARKIMTWDAIENAIMVTDAITVETRPLGESPDAFVNTYPDNPDLIRTLENPHSTLGGLAIMRGNLPPIPVSPSPPPWQRRCGNLPAPTMTAL